MNGGAGIELDHVAKRYESPSGSVRAVDGVSLEVQPGTSLAITGPSGCGKSTLLGLIGGLDVPTAGRVSIGGRVVSAMTESDRARLRRSQVGFVFQSDNLLPFLTAIENVEPAARTDAGDDDGDGSADRAARASRSRARRPTSSPTSSPAGSASAWPWPAP